MRYYIYPANFYIQNDIKMSYELQQITKSLRNARLAKGMSQAELGKLAEVPQAQISRIEANAVDLRLSSLVALAHALDMEVTLAPRKAMPAIRSIARQTADQETLQSPVVGRELKRLREAIGPLQADIPPAPLQELRKAFGALRALYIDPQYLGILRDTRATIERARDSLDPRKAAMEAVRNMQLLRNQIAHAPPKSQMHDPPKPAYTLDEDDDA